MKLSPLLALLAACAAAHPLPDVEGVKGELERRYAIDQQVRSEVNAAGLAHFDPVKAARMEAIDRDNTSWLKGVLARDGWIGARTYGMRACRQAFVLVQHADFDRAFQKDVLSMMERAVPVGDAKGVDLAYLDDRIAWGEHRPQRYGTQGKCVSGAWEPGPLQDPAGVDARRKAVGMPPLADYQKELSADCK